MFFEWQVICDLIFQIVLFAVVNESTGCRYDLQSLQRELLHKWIPGVALFEVLGCELNFELVSIDFMFRGCLSARTVFEFSNFRFVSL